MRGLKFFNSRYGISIAIFIALIGISFGPVPFGGTPVFAQTASDPVIAAAGDIACDPSNSSFNDGNGNAAACRQKFTSDLLLNENFAAVLPLGDVQYHCGGYQAFLQAYDPSWGRVKAISHPVVGNHEYLQGGGTDCNSANEGAGGYFRYFGEAAGNPGQGYYSFDIGAWHLIALNSNCSDAGGCEAGSPQAIWLAADLASHPNLCTLAYWHIPLFSSGGRTSANTRTLWQILYNNDVDLILNGHDHIYERFAPQTPDGTPDPVQGISQFVVGTGGSNLTEIETVSANSEVRNNDTYGILKLTLHPGSYDWQFVPEVGKTFTDSGRENCHGTAPAGAAVVAATQTLPSSPTPTPVTTAFTFTPVADAYVSKTKPALNFGASNMLRLFGGPIGASYMRFDVQDVPGSVTRATLRVYAYNASQSGYQVRTVSDNNWNEFTIAYGNAPPIGDLIALSGPFNAKKWTSVDLTSLVKGNGTYSIALISFNRTAFSLASRNAISPLVPQLVVEVPGGSTTAHSPAFAPTVEPLIATESAE